MEKMRLLSVNVFLSFAVALLPQAPLFPQQDGPSIASATSNANLLFNSIYSSMRQWGNSVQHNGMSFFPAYVPEGTLLYHGGPKAERVKGLEWLAFEIQHAEMFALVIKFKSEDGEGVGERHTEIDKVLDMRSEPVWRLEQRDPPGFEIEPGYLHIYQTNRPLKLLYIDGMSAAKCDLGPMDTQDNVLLNFTWEKFLDRKRAQQLCALADEFEVEGFIRMEAGFEIIKCDFSQSLDFVSHRRRPNVDEPEGYIKIGLLDYMREVEGRYHGIDAGRVTLDYSSMTSAYFYSANLSNPAQKPGQSILPRLVGSEKKVLARIKSDLRQASRDSNLGAGVDWQGVADMITKRYSSRLQFMATDPPQQTFLSQINSLLNLFVEYGTAVAQNSVEHCSLHYLQPVQATTEQDRLIEAAFKTVTQRICKTLFQAREILLAREREGDRSLAHLENSIIPVDLIRDLILWLDWSDWQACGHCALNEVCFIAVFPFGKSDDHHNPRCQNSTSLRDRIGPDNYWM